jgi:NAD(P)-dependent dehydrogenase (short-subunit alcohol dehydrogenase family)
MAERLKDKVALVTGAGSGIGRASALALAREGAKVVVADVNGPGGSETVSLINKAGGQALFVQADVSRSSQVEEMVRAAVKAYGKLDCAFNNAGIEGTPALTADYPEEVWNRVLAINLTGMWLCMKYEIPQMLAQKSGAIVNCASILGQVGFATAPAYVASKHGLLGLTKTAAIEYAARGIRINAVCPGFIETPMLERGGITTRPEVREQITALHPMKRLGRPEEVAHAVVWLCSEEASFVTGQALLVDGGYVAQ